MKRTTQLTDRRSAVRGLNLLAAGGILLVIAAASGAMAIAESKNQGTDVPAMTDKSV